MKHKVHIIIAVIIFISLVSNSFAEFRLGLTGVLNSGAKDLDKAYEGKNITNSNNPSTNNPGTATSYTLTKSVNPGGSGTISLSPSGSTYTAGTTVTLTAIPASGYSFVNWTSDYAYLNGSSNNPTIITVNSNLVIIAIFHESPTYSYVTSAYGGTVSPSGGTFTAGTSVTLTATPSSGYSFVNWTSDYGGVGGESNPYTFTAPGINLLIIANFKAR
jgi:hypothetical protein